MGVPGSTGVAPAKVIAFPATHTARRPTSLLTFDPCHVVVGQGTVGAHTCPGDRGGMLARMDFRRG